MAFAAVAQTVSKLTVFASWTVYAGDEAKHRFCFVTAEPKTSTPANANRDTPRAYISAWPKDGIKSELSFRLGFPVKKDAEIKVKTDHAAFKLFSKGDRAYVQDPLQELKLVEAMKKGVGLEIEATSEKGTRVFDTYALAGINQALEAMQKACF